MSGKPHALNAQQCERMIHLYETQGLSVEVIAVRLESNPMTIWRTLKRHGVQIRANSRQSKLNIEDVIRRYRNGESSNEIAESCGLRGESIRYRLRKAGVLIRSKRDAASIIHNEWTPERQQQLKSLWLQGVPAGEIRERLGISYGEKSVMERARKMGLQSRQGPHRSGSKISTIASAVASARQYQDRSIITFLPESPRLEMEFRHLVAEERQRRAAV
jgi:hypothetical protein